jgi:predicted GNAT family acetyltransferase
MSNVEVVHIPENSRYEIHVDGEVAGYSEAKDRDDGVVLFSHTVVDDEYEGQGLASQLVAGALDDIRQRGRRIEVTCEYVEDFLEKHAEYQDLVVDTG